MSHFYGEVHGKAPTAGIRQGDEESGITTYAASWEGAIKVTLFVDEKGRDCYHISHATWHGKGKAGFIAEGIVGVGEGEIAE